MNEKLREILDKINGKKLEVQNLAEAGKIEEAKQAKEELKNLQEQFDLLSDILDQLPAANTLKPADPEDSVKAFANAARQGFKVANAMKEGSGADGGYTVPQDIQTQIHAYREAKFSLLNLVTIVNVDTTEGSRVFKKRAQQTGFSKVGEGAKIGAKATPQFERIAYKIDKYAGYFPVTNELLSDSDANITATLIGWIGDESRVTANKLILAKIKEKDAVDVADVDGIKKVLNVTLGAAFKSTSSIVTNDNGLQYLDTLKDNNGRYLLSPNPDDTMQMRLAVGGSFVPVRVIPNADMPNDEIYALTADTDIVDGKTYYTKSGETYEAVDSPLKANIGTYYEMESRIPMIIGDLKEGICYFDRQRTNIMTSNVAAIGELNAFEEDLTIFRAIEREDVESRDTEAFVNGYIVA